MAISLGHIVVRLGVPRPLRDAARPILDDGIETGAYMRCDQAHPSAAVLARAGRILAAYRADPASRYWELPVGCPRRDPSAARVTICARVAEVSQLRFAAERERTGEKLGELLDRLAAGL